VTTPGRSLISIANSVPARPVRTVIAGDDAYMDQPPRVAAERDGNRGVTWDRARESEGLSGPWWALVRVAARVRVGESSALDPQCATSPRSMWSREQRTSKTSATVSFLSLRPTKRWSRQPTGPNETGVPSRMGRCGQPAQRVREVAVSGGLQCEGDCRVAVTGRPVPVRETSSRSRRSRWSACREGHRPSESSFS